MGYRVQHSITRGPVEGRDPVPSRRHAGRGQGPGDVDDVEVRVVEHPVRRRQGRRHGRPQGCRRASYERLTRRYTSEIASHRPGPGHPGARRLHEPAVMAWIMDTYSMTQGYSTPGVVTGKPLAIGGSAGRNEATAEGCFVAIEEAAKRMRLALKGATAAVQGYGNAGAFAAKFLDEAGVQDRRGLRLPGRPLRQEGSRLDLVSAAKQKKGAVTAAAARRSRTTSSSSCPSTSSCRRLSRA